MSKESLNEFRLDRRGFLTAAAGAAATGAAVAGLGPLAGKSAGQAAGDEHGCEEHAAELPKFRRGAIMYTMPAVAWNSEAAFLDHIAFMKSLNCNAWEFASAYPTPAGNNPDGWVAMGSYARTYGYRVVGTHDGPQPTTAAVLGSAITKMNAWNCNQLGQGSGWPSVPGAGTAITTPTTISAWQASCATMNAWGRSFQTGNGQSVLPTPYGQAQFNGASVQGRANARYYRHFHSEQGKWISNTGTKYDNNYISALAYTELDNDYAFAESDLCWLMDGLWMAGGGPGVGLQGAGDPNPGQGNNRLVAPDVIERWQDKVAMFHVKDLGPTDQGSTYANVGDNNGPGADTYPFGALRWDPSQDTTPFQAIFERLRHLENHEFLFERDGQSATVTSNAYYKKLYVQAFDMMDQLVLDRSLTRAPFKIPFSDADWAAIQVTGIGGSNRPPVDGGSPGPMCGPTLNGVFEVGGTVKVSFNGTWSRFKDKKVNYQYIWLRDGAPLTSYNGATVLAAHVVDDEPSYKIVADDVGHKISCQVIALGSDGNASTETTDEILISKVPVIGTHQLGATTESVNAGVAMAFQATANKNGAAKALDVYVETGSTATWLVAGIYVDNGTGKHPDALLTSGEVKINNKKQAGWVTVTFDHSVTLTKGDVYWIAILGTGGTVNFRDANGAGGTSPSESSKKSGLAELPLSWKTGTVYKKDGPLSAGTPVASAT